jgi:hypothetical protein
LRDVFDLLNKDASSPLLGLMSPSERRRGRISRVTFNAALRPIFVTFGGSDAEYVYRVLNAYLQAWLSGLRALDADEKITNPTLFRAVMLLFPAVAARSSDRYGEEYTVDNFADVLKPVFAN